jgi:hypothetical protein
MAHKHHPKEARIRAVQQQDGGRPASDICKDMNITPWDCHSFLVQHRVFQDNKQARCGRTLAFLRTPVLLT